MQKKENMNKRLLFSAAMKILLDLENGYEYESTYSCAMFYKDEVRWKKDEKKTLAQKINVNLRPADV